MPLPDRDDELVLLHNPRCSKSRAAKALLDERGADYALRPYLEEPLTRAELVELRARLGLPVAAWTRRGEAAFGRAGLAPDGPEEALLDAMAAEPILMERPILLRGGRAVVGRPPERILELLG